MKRKFTAALLFTSSLLCAQAAGAGTAEEIKSLYTSFLDAQNARDLGRVQALLLDSPTFLWVSDGKSIWGPKATIERMSSFQGAPVWRVDPGLDAARVVATSENVAYLHLPLRLTIGSPQNPDKFDFLVSMLSLKTAAGWRIAALFTTPKKDE